MLERLMHPGVLLVLLGAVSAYGSGKWADRLLKGNPHGDLIFKGIGCVLAAAGAVWLFTT